MSWFSSSPSLEQKFAATDYRPSGFDYMRLFLAAGVIALHSVVVSYGQMVEIAFWESPARPLIRLVLPMFFALSGFLVAGSLIRSRTLGRFLGLRVIRIFPALGVEVILSAFILGLVFTNLTFTAYLQHPELHQYFWNIVGHVHFSLPGVFADNPHPGVVNGQLWTVPYELYCYIILALLALIGTVQKRYISVVGAFVLVILYVGFKVARDSGVPPYTTGPVPGTLLVACFLLGVAGYFYRESIPHHWGLGVASGIASGILLTVVPYGEYIAPVPLTYFTVYLGLLNPPRAIFINGADYSYGLFLYGYPIQQALAATSSIWQYWIANFLGTMLIGIIFAAFSWHWVEKPALRGRVFLAAMEERWLATRAEKAKRK